MNEKSKYRQMLAVIDAKMVDDCRTFEKTNENILRPSFTTGWHFKDIPEEDRTLFEAKVHT